MKRIAGFDRPGLTAELDLEGQAVLSGLLTPGECDAMAEICADASLFCETLSLATVDRGQGELRRFAPRVPPLLRALQEMLYAQLAPVANHWNGALGLDERYPADLDGFLQECRQAGLRGAKWSMSRLCKRDYLALHRSSEAAHVFPVEVSVLLSEPDRDFTGGEFVMTEQRPRMQSRPMVVPLRRGDAALLAGHQRPLKGSNGYYRVSQKHAVSQVRSGKRIAVDLQFQDAP